MADVRSFRLKECLRPDQARHLTKMLNGRFFDTYTASETVYDLLGYVQVLNIYHWWSYPEKTRMRIELEYG